MTGTQAEEQQRGFRAAIDASADLVFLFDAARMRYIDANETACRALGYSRGELLTMGPHQVSTRPREELTALYARLLAGDPEACSSEAFYRRKDGSRLMVETSRRVVPFANGHVIIAVARDIGERKRAEQLLKLEHSVTRALAAAPSVEQALKEVLRSVCETLEWECGRYFRRDEAGTFRFAASWHVPSPALEEFIAYSATKAFPAGVGIVGRAGAGEPMWVADVGHDARVISAVMANEHGMRGAFMFPVTSAQGALGVLSFTSRVIREPDERLLEAARVIGSQVGQFIQRMQSEEVLRESEERFRSLTELSSDWYWEQDQNFRFVDMSNAAGNSSERGPLSSIGQARWDVPALNMSEADWAAHRAVLEAHQPFRDLELHRRTADGKSKYTSISGRPIFDRSGVFKGYRGVGKDITERKRREQLRRLEHAVTRCLSESEDASHALKSVIQTICESEGWECGRYFHPDEQTGVLRLREAWGLPNEAVGRYIAASRDIAYGPGVGLVGRVWESAQPLWVPDLYTDPRVSQRPLARDTGMHGAFVFPVVSDGNAIGVLAFNSREIRHPEERLLQAIHVIGSQIGQFLRRKQSEEVLRESEARFRAVVDSANEGILIYDRALRVSGGNAAAERIIGLPISKMVGAAGFTSLLPCIREDGSPLPPEERPTRVTVATGRPQAGRIFGIKRPDTSVTWVSVNTGFLRRPGEADHYGVVSTISDITERKQHDERIHYLANHDALTALPNRAMFSDVLQLSIHNARRYQRGFAVLFIDLDRFKIINDTLGHEAGDRLLQEMGTRLADTVRASDVVARLGGDEFVVLVQEVSEPKQVEAVARKILSALMKPMVIREQECRVTASVGICMYPGDAQDEQALMKNADIAMYRAKEEGKNTYKFYSEETNVHSFERLALETSLRRALERHEFLLHYQAKLDLRTSQISGVEALVRWNHPDLGMVPPGQFIPLAEETGLIVPLGKWVLNAACAQNVAWQEQGLPPLRMAVNLSARQFSDDNLLDDIAAALASSGMSPHLLELELTESMVMQNEERAGKVLGALKKLGVRLAIDDFGVGYSSLTSLKRFPIDTLKVDRSFIRDIPEDTDDIAITQAIIAMGKSLKLTVVAEGVETLAQQTFLHEQDCDEMQGFYFSKPIPADQFGQLLRLETEKNQARGSFSSYCTSQ